MIDYDYIMKLITDFQAKPAGKATMSREQLIGLIAADSKFLDERDAITEYVRGLKAGEGLDEAAIRAGYQRFKDEKHAAELAAAAQKHGLPPESLQAFVDTILSRMIFDGEQLTELLAPLELWLACPHGKGTGPDGRPRPAPEKTRRRPRHLRAQGVRGMKPEAVRRKPPGDRLNNQERTGASPPVLTVRVDVIKTVKPHAKSNRAASRAVPRFLAEAAGASPPGPSCASGRCKNRQTPRKDKPDGLLAVPLRAICSCLMRI